VVADVVVAKYADRCPLYRQALIFARLGIEIDRATLAFWVGYAAPEIKPLWRLMREGLAFCWAHWRRQWFDITKSPPAPPATEALKRIAELYEIEGGIGGKSADERRAVQQ